MNKIKLFSGNVLKIIALITMTIDHIGLFLFPDVKILRIIGRIAFPIFAFFIAEGCKYTKNKPKYLFLILGIGLLCQILINPFIDFYNLNILFSFSFSILMIYIFQWVKSSFINHKTKSIIFSIIVFVVYLTLLILLFAPHIHFSTFTIEYGFFGILIPFFTFIFDKWYIKLSMFSLGLLLTSIFIGGSQYFCLLSVLLLLMYNGKRGKFNLKYLFYIYYPLHLILLILI